MQPDKHELSQQLYGSQQHSMGATEAIKEAFLAIAPGLKDLGHDVKEELKHMGNLGRSELANAIFGQGAFVLYSHEPENDHSKQHDHDQHLERGLSM